MIKVLIVDDHGLVRKGITRIIEDVAGMQVVGESENGESAIRDVRTLKPDVVLMDVNMPGIGGLGATSKIVKAYPRVNVIALSVHGSEPFPSRLLQAGAKGYLTKGASPQEVIDAIITVAKGKRYLSSNVAQEIALKQLNEKEGSPIDIISDRELQVLLMIASAQKVQEISDKLCLSPKTVNSYRYRLFDKLKVSSDVELTHFAIRHGLVNSEEMQLVTE